MNIQSYQTVLLYIRVSLYAIFHELYFSEKQEFIYFVTFRNPLQFLEMNDLHVCM